MEMDNKPVIVIGHRNPDTDSICSAICYARLKNLITDGNYIPKRAGHLNEETQFVLDHVNVAPPEYIKDVRPQVNDIEIKRIKGVSSDISVRDAWKLMKEVNAETLPVTQGTKLTGLITIGDIARSNFEIYDNTILSIAKTRFCNIVDTLEGEVITGDANGRFEQGKVMIAAGNPEVIENYIQSGDIVVLGNRYESQLCAIEMNATCLIICEGAKVSLTITKVAKANHCIIISTKYDAYTVARLMNQSMPIHYLMRRANDGIIKFKTYDFIEDIQEVMAKKRHRDFPIEDEQGRYVGMISRRHLLKAGKKKLILVDHNEKNQAVGGVETAEILEIIDHHRLGAIQTMTPVFFRNQPLGCTATIIYQMYRENQLVPDQQTAALLCSAIISDTLIFRSPTCTAVDIEACTALAQIAGIDINSYGPEMFKAGSNLVSKSVKDIFFQDFKRFSVNDVSIGVGQINSMSSEELESIKDKIVNFIEEVAGENGISMAFFMLTDIMSEATQVICAGKNAVSLLANAYSVEPVGNCVYLRGVVSRKKQLFPTIMEALQQ